MRLSRASVPADEVLSFIATHEMQRKRLAKVKSFDTWDTWEFI